MKNDFLTETERDLVIAFNENTLMKNAVVKVLTHSIYELGIVRKDSEIMDIKTNWILRCTPSFNSDLKDATPEEIGKKVISVSEGLVQLDAALINLDEYKKVAEKTEEEPKVNNAR